MKKAPGFIRPVIFTDTKIALSESPINPDWIIEGNPVAHSCILSRSDDQTACTIVWDCSNGKFNWYYGFDETVHITHGSVTVHDGISAPRKLLPGDVAFFPAGSHAVWTVEDHVRKVAFCRKVLPGFLGVLVKLLRKVKNQISPPKAASASLMAAL